MSTRDIELTTKPNKYAPANDLKIESNQAHFMGYQEFALDISKGEVTPIGAPLKQKAEILNPVFQKSIFSGRTFVDLGGNNGYFAWKASSLGSPLAKVVDMDEQCITHIERVRHLSNRQNVQGVLANVAEWQEKADVVMALALVHWLHSCTSSFKSLAKMIDWLAGLAEDGLIIEWIAPSDPLIEKYGHLEVQQETNDYSEEVFHSSLKKHFAEVEFLGAISPTRLLFWAKKKKPFPDFSWSAPLRFDKKTVLSSRLLCIQENVPMWSRVYKVQDRIFKQASPTLAKRELLASQLLNNTKFLNIRLEEKNEDWWLISYPYFDGVDLSQVLPELRTEERLAIFEKLLQLVLTTHGAGIKHRDIHPSNILIDRQQLDIKLIDFGWATIPSLADITPDGLGNHFGFIGRPDNDPSDLCALGEISKLLSNKETPELSIIHKSLCSKSWTMRIDTDEEIIEFWSHLKSLPDSILNRWLLCLQQEQLFFEQKLTSYRKQNDVRIQDLESQLIHKASELENFIIKNNSKICELELVNEKLARENHRLEQHGVQLAAHIDNLNKARDELQASLHGRPDPNQVGMIFFAKHFLNAFRKRILRSFHA